MTSELPAPVTDVVVPLDGSLAAEAALRTGFSVVERTGGRVLLVRAIDPDEDATAVAAELDLHVVRFGDVAPVEVSISRGPAGDVILDAAGGEATICMATHGRTGATRLLMGSVAEEVIRRSELPVLLTGPGARSLPLRTEHASMLIGCAESCTTEEVVAAAAGFARSLGLECWVVEAIGPDEDVALDDGRPPRPVLDAATARADERRRALVEAGVEARSKVRFGDPALVLEQSASTLRASFVVVMTHGRTGLARIAQGSTTAHVIRHAPCPVLVTVSR